MEELQPVEIKLLQKESRLQHLQSTDNENLNQFYQDVSECFKQKAPLITPEELKQEIIPPHFHSNEI
jgi:hypothetical protein